jgi:hypothetical protein
MASAKESTRPQAGKKASAKQSVTKKSAVVLARLKVMGPLVSVRAAGRKKFLTATDNQVLRQGDSIKTDAAGLAGIDYTDGSFTRLGNSTRYTITTLTNKKGARQTNGTLSVGQTWNRATKVSESGSFEVTAGGATAAVEGTAFSYSCQKGVTGLLCEVVDVVDNVTVSSPNGGVTVLDPATSVALTDGVLSGGVTELTYEDLVSNPFIASNVALDYYIGRGAGFDEFPPPTTTTTVPRRRAPTTLPTPEPTPPPPTPPPPTAPPTTLPPPTLPPTTTVPCEPSNRNPC